MVRDAPTFSSLADDLLARLEGRLFIAHNARFDHIFLRKAFKQTGHVMRNDILCTVKLSRALFPDEPKHNLGTLITRHALLADARHRALADADVLWQLWNKFSTTVAAVDFDRAVQQQLKRPVLPPHLGSDAFDDIPDGGGVYLFYDARDEVIYIGKGSNLRQRIGAHFNPDRRLTADIELADLVHRIDWQPIIGEVGLQLAEAVLLRQFRPAQNRTTRRQTELCSWSIQSGAMAPVAPELVFASKQNFGRAQNLYGLFGTRRKAEARLREVADSHQLCLIALGLEQRMQPHGPCLAHALQRCRGVCIGRESPVLHQVRLESALSNIKVKAWPYAGAIGLVETAPDGRQDIHMIQNWRYLGTAHAEDEIEAICHRTTELPVFDLDSYKILARVIGSASVTIRMLPELG